MADFASRLKELRLACGMSQQELADRLKVHAMTISGYERGVRKPDFDMLDALADILDASMDYLLGSSSVNAGYPGHQHNKIMHDPDADKRLNAHGIALVKAYNAASEDTQAAINAILHLDAVFAKLDKETHEKHLRKTNNREG